MSELLSNIKKQLDQKGKGFCAAKWTQVTIHLGTGMTHSCHHPSPHKIPLIELKNNFCEKKLCLQCAIGVKLMSSEFSKS